MPMPFLTLTCYNESSCHSERSEESILQYARFVNRFFAIATHDVL
jgi:hypothetical protein